MGIYQFAALEGLLLKNASEPIQQNIADRMAFFATTDPNARGRIIASVKDAYHLRSQFLHHAKLSPDIEVLTRFARNSWQFVLVVISKMSDYQTTNDTSSSQQ